MTTGGLALALLLSLDQAPASPAMTDAERRAAMEQTVREIQRSHLDENLPPAADFHRLLQRDLERHFAKERGVGSIAVAFELLREKPTQTGIAFPKFYVWVRLGEGTSPADRGAVRVAATQGTGFAVLEFVTEVEIERDPRIIESIFPGPVCERIRQTVAGGPKN